MKNQFFITLAGVSLLTFFGQRTFCAEKTDAQAELQQSFEGQVLQQLEGRIQAKMNEGKRMEKDFTEELKEFDALLARHKEEKTDEVARIVLMKAILFKQLGDAERGVTLVKQLKSDFPATGVANDADIIFASVEIRCNGKNPPPLEIIQKNVARYGGEAVKDIAVIGLHKEREGAYIVITNRNSNSWGGPYTLLRLESNDWVMNRPGSLFTEYVFIVN